MSFEAQIKIHSKQSGMTPTGFKGITPPHQNQTADSLQGNCWEAQSRISPFSYSQHQSCWSLLPALAPAFLTDAGLFTPAYLHNQGFQVEMN